MAVIRRAGSGARRAMSGFGASRAAARARRRETPHLGRRSRAWILGPRAGWARRAVSNSISEGRPRRVLVVDDERHVRSMLCDLLEHMGCQADGVRDPLEGLERLERGTYDVLVTDFR